MKTVSVREAQHNLAKVLRVVEGGESVEIVRRKVPVARLTPVDSTGETEIDWSGHSERMAAVWGNRMIKGLDDTLEDSRGPR